MQFSFTFSFQYKRRFDDLVTSIKADNFLCEVVEPMTPNAVENEYTTVLDIDQENAVIFAMSIPDIKVVPFSKLNDERLAKMKKTVTVKVAKCSGSTS